MVEVVSVSAILKKLMHNDLISAPASLLKKRKCQDEITIKCVFNCYRSTIGNKGRIIYYSLLHMMGQYKETIACSASTEEVMSHTQ